MTFLDWCLLWIPISVVIVVALYTTKYNKSVVDFIAAGRCAGRYLLATARGEAGSAAITAIALFQMTSKTGFAFQFWGPLYSSVPILVTISGWVVYRFRETRVLTPGQFYEVRYSRNFRLFMGGIAFLSGIMNYGIFPAVSSRFFVYYLQLPQSVAIFHVAVATWQLIAFCYLCCCLFFVLVGGQISILVSDCLEGLFSQIGYVVIVVTLLLIFGWNHMVQSLTAAPPHQSMVNPFDMQKTQDFNLYFILIGLFGAVYHSNVGGFTASASTPHELRMSNILGSWRGFAFALMRTILAICAVTFLINPDFAGQSVAAHAQIQSIADPAVRDQMQVPIAASHFLPYGIKGLFCAIMLMGVLTGDAGALHNYGTGFIQDIVLPLRKTEMSPAEHMRWLRWSVVGVALFGLVFSSFFRQTQYIQLYWAVTGAIYAGGAGSVLIGGLYWKKGTATGAWVAMCSGAVLSLGGIILQQVYRDRFPIHGQYVSLIAMTSSITIYIVVSLLTYRGDFNMDRMLHRGQYAVEGEEKIVAPPFWQRINPAKLIGIDEEFTFWDRVVAFGIFGWITLTLSVMLTVLVWNVIHPWPTHWWVNYWFVLSLSIPLVISIVTTIWFTIGVLRELRVFFRRLASEKRDASDDGTVGPGHPI